MSGVRIALFWSLAERYLLIVLALASNIILARLLTPEEIGIFSVSLAVIGIAQVLRDFGLGNFLIQEKNLTDDHVRTAFGLSLLIGVVLCVPTVALAGVIAQAYGEWRMAQTLRICALNFVVLPFCTISVALLRRDMQFRRLTAVTLSAAVLGFAVTLSTALLGMGPDSMAIGAVCMNVATGIGAWLARGGQRLLAPSLREWRRLLHFGAHSSAASVVTSVSMDINDLAIGKLLGMAPVAMYSRAQGLVAMFTREVLTAVRNVALPAFARAHREGSALEAQYVKSTASLAAVGWPFFGFLALYPLELVRLMYGTQWDRAAALVPVLALGGAAYTTACLAYTALTAVGRIDLVSRAELLFQPLRAGVVVGAALAFGTLEACAWAATVMFVAYVPLALHVKGRAIANDRRALLGGLARTAVATMLTLALPVAIVGSFGWSRTDPMPLGWFCLAAASGLLSWPLSLHLVRHPIGIAELAHSALRRFRRPKPLGQP